MMGKLTLKEKIELLSREQRSKVSGYVDFLLESQNQEEDLGKDLGKDLEPKERTKEI